ncbi:MAG TPA: STAS domain-containing protein [Candidatus Eremiobacteraceae bacterium]|nr:STAS domain-containing protein [Candidatus Eremiobacteraceae bacterium]
MTLQTLPATRRWNLFKIEGQLDFAAAPTIQTALLHAAHLDQSDLLIDLEDLTSADEIGVAKLTGAVQKLVAERPSLQIAFVAKDSWLASHLSQTQLPKPVVIFRSGSEALKAIGLNEAA